MSSAIWTSVSFMKLRTFQIFGIAERVDFPWHSCFAIFRLRHNPGMQKYYIATRLIGISKMVFCCLWVWNGSLGQERNWGGDLCWREASWSPGLASPPGAEKRQEKREQTTLGRAAPFSRQLWLTRFIFSVSHVPYSSDLYLHWRSSSISVICCHEVLPQFFMPSFVVLVICLRYQYAFPTFVVLPMSMLNRMELRKDPCGISEVTSLSCEKWHPISTVCFTSFLFLKAQWRVGDFPSCICLYRKQLLIFITRSQRFGDHLGLGKNTANILSFGNRF